MNTCPICGSDPFVVESNCPHCIIAVEQAKTAAIREAEALSNLPFPDPALAELYHWKQRAEKAEAEIEARKRAWKEANAEFEQMRERAEKAEAAVAEMRVIVEEANEQSKLYAEHEGRFWHALSTDCGKGYLPPDKARVLREALVTLILKDG